MKVDRSEPGLNQTEDLCHLAAALAHEIKNPAALALAHIAQLRKREDLIGIGDTCDHIEEAIEHICCLVQEMLLVTYGTAPAYDFDIEDMLVDMRDVYQVAWPQITFTLEADSLGEGLMYHGEESYMKIVFTNLLKNAVEAVGSTGVIGIGIKKTKGYGVITVKDSGIGNTVLKRHASGMGLAICKWLLGRVGGQLTLSASEGSGCEASVVLPLV
ncbi:MAG: HAMP domain-containing histidine kinase [Defluviitaleaceae bacterium]|nr:HAMP domain-containing histidine kinase [Defluviitaleaceae bacterium]